MNPQESRHLFKYFDLADRFVRIRATSNLASELTFDPESGRRGYRVAVVRACVEGYDEDPESAFAVDHPADPDAALNLLYHLVVSVNPDLDIHAVSLGEAHETQSANPTPKASAKRAKMRKRAKRIDERLNERVFGQEPAVEAVARAVKRASVGLNHRGPLGTLLFVGPTGTGKTELARGLAEELGAELVRIDCSEFAEAHEYSKLIGAPPGFLGHGEGGHLTETVRANPNAVVLFDEVEKAHARLHHLLLSVLDEGHLTDGKGQKTDFRNTFVILTSNAGTAELERASGGLGFGANALTTSASGEIVDHALADTFRPEFLARLDETVLFRDLGREEALQIAQRELTNLAVRVRRGRHRLSIKDSVARWLTDEAFGRAGARGVLSTLRREIEGPLADLLLEASPGWIEVSIRGGKPRFSQVD